MIWPLLAGVAIGFVIAVLLLIAVVNHVEREELVTLDRYLDEEYEPQRDPVLDRILDDIDRERSADPRQTARDSATSARTKSWRR